jgi:hypothetical protein
MGRENNRYQKRERESPLVLEQQQHSQEGRKEEAECGIGRRNQQKKKKKKKPDVY